jgi:uncharacterized membrane protein
MGDDAGSTGRSRRLRETSILFGALLAFLMLKEKVAGLRIVAACGIAAGAILLRLS